MPELISAESRRLARSAIGADDRVLVLGAGGWFGRTALDLLSGQGAAVHAVASAAREIRIRDETVPVATWDDGEIRDFSPTVVVDCAFLTRDRVDDLGMERYVAINRSLTERLLAAARLPEVALVLTVSSGAAVSPTDALAGPVEANPYGYLKREAELALTALGDDERRVGIARAWSVSGAYNRRPRDYALGDMVLQAREGEIGIRAGHEVWRRYVLAEELLAVTLALARRTPGASLVDSGGPLVEMAELAEAVRRVVAPTATIRRREPDGDPPDRYHSDGASWASACRVLDYRGCDLEEQIELTARGVAEVRN